MINFLTTVAASVLGFIVRLYSVHYLCYKHIISTLFACALDRSLAFQACVPSSARTDVCGHEGAVAQFDAPIISNCPGL